MKNSKFISLYETIYDRYKQGAGFLQGDVVKLKSNYKSAEGYKSLSEMLRQRLDDAEKSGYNLRIGRLHTPQTSAGSMGINTSLPATHVDLYQEPSPGSYGNLVTIPIDLIEYIDTGINLPEVSSKNRRPNKDYIKPSKMKANKDEPETKEQNHVGEKQRYAKKGDYKLAEKNVKPSVGGNKYDDEKPSKFKPLKGTKTLTRESVGLEGIYTQMITEDATTGMSSDVVPWERESDTEFDVLSYIKKYYGPEIAAQFEDEQGINGRGFPVAHRAKRDYVLSLSSPEEVDKLLGSYKNENTNDVDQEDQFAQVEELIANFGSRMNDSGGFGEPDRAIVYGAIRNGDFKTAAEEICYSYTDQDGGEIDMQGHIGDIESELNYIFNTNMPSEATPDVAPNSSGSEPAGEVNLSPEDREQTSAL